MSDEIITQSFDGNSHVVNNFASDSPKILTQTNISIPQTACDHTNNASTVTSHADVKSTEGCQLYTINDTVYKYTVDILPWDGSHLGDFTGIFDPNKKDELWIFSFPLYTNILLPAYIKKISSSYPCVIDEIKPIFGIIKNGTHRFTCNNSLYIMIKPSISYQLDINANKMYYVISPNIPVNYQTKYHQTQLDSIRRIVVFRKILGLRTTISDISIRHDGLAIMPNDCVTNTAILKNDNITQKAFVHWFNDCTISNCICNMFNITNKSMIIELSLKLRNQLEDVICRIDNDHVGLIDIIVNKVIEFIDI